MNASANGDNAEQPLVATLQRNSDNGKCMLGRLTLPSGLVLATIERPWKDNKPNISCIPAGTYRCVLSMSPRFRRMLYEVQNVPNRAGIRIHVANWASELHGCIAVGLVHGPDMVLKSTIAMQRMNDQLRGRPFTLQVLAVHNNSGAQ